MSKSKKQSINNLVVVSDLHCGCRLALCPPHKIKLDEGGYYTPSKLQKKVYKCWEYFWNEWVPFETKGEPFAVVINGDSLDGVHHKSVTQVSNNLSDQANIAEELLKPVVDLCKGRFYFIRGTEAHVGPSGQEEERLAKVLGAIPDEEGRFSRWEMKIRIGWGLVHLTHHIGTSSSMAYETSAIQRALQNMYVEAARWENEPPDCLVRSHRHRNCETRVRIKKNGRVGFASSFTTAGWQLKTPFVYRTAGSDTKPQIGGSMVRCGDSDIFAKHCIWDIEETKIETPEA
uniref:Calcineurin-like phosphoesterase n=1 Tax=viral metagenome TaxID=1070528 RepID=A0A6M3J1H3_9ZZZZ